MKDKERVKKFFIDGRDKAETISKCNVILEIRSWKRKRTVGKLLKLK